MEDEPACLGMTCSYAVDLRQVREHVKEREDIQTAATSETI